MPRIYIKTFGCQMNDRDSEALAGLFLERGYILVKSPKEADVILVNTCSVREHAENRAISFLGTLKNLSHSTACSRQTVDKKEKTMDYGLWTMDYPQRRKPVVGLIGCMAKSRGEELFKKMPHIDLVVAPGSFDRIPEYIEKILTANSQEKKATGQEKEATGYRVQGTGQGNTQYTIHNTRIVDLEDRLRSEDFYRAPFRVEEGHAYVVISTGCSNYCSYCVVPFVRGPLRLRKPKDIIDEIRRNVSLGIKKITLLGQNVNDYCYKSAVSSQQSAVNFLELLKMVEEVEGLEEIDFVTSHPKNTSRELFEFMANSKKVKKHLHLPFQSGSDKILKLMNRGYTKEEYLNLVDDYKKIVGGSLSTDVIVGFPTETEEDFLETRDVLEKARFKYAYIFKYSPRPKTQASTLKDDVPWEEKERRHKLLLELQKRISLSF